MQHFYWKSRKHWLSLKTFNYQLLSAPLGLMHCKILPFLFLQKDAKMDILYHIMRVPKKLSGLPHHFPLSASYLLKFSGYSLTLIILVSVILPSAQGTKKLLNLTLVPLVFVFLIFLKLFLKAVSTATEQQHVSTRLRTCITFNIHFIYPSISAFCPAQVQQ